MFIDFAQQPDQTACQLGKEFLIRYTALGFAVFRIGKYQINIGRNIQLPPPQFTHANHEEGLRYAIGQWYPLFPCQLAIQPAR